MNTYYVVIIFLIFSACKTPSNVFIYEGKSLKIEQLTDNTYRHITYLNTHNYGKIGCNGIIVRDGNEAIIVDTPTTDKESKELINWVEKNLKSKVAGVVVTHFHEDCLGGLNEFHLCNIPSYASNRTIELAKLENKTLPQNGFEHYLELSVGNKKVINEFMGEGHTMDNIVCYFPDEKVLFGGCLVKEVGARKGFLGDANVNAWSNSVRTIKNKYKNVHVVIPGHGKPGAVELLDYTLDLFSEN